MIIYIFNVCFSTPTKGSFMTKPESRPSRTLRAADILPACLGLFLALMYALAMRFDFEYDIGHFSRTSFFFHAAAAAAAAGVLLALAEAFLTRRKIFDPLPGSSPVSVFGAVMAAAMSVSAAVLTLSSYMRSVPEEGLTPAKMSLASALLGLCLGASALLNLSKEQRGGQAVPVVTAVLGVFSVNLAMFAAYFDFSVPLNSPVRNFTTLAQAAVLLFLLSEARLTLVKGPDELPVPFQRFAETAAVTVGFGVSFGGVLYRLMILGSAHSPEPNLSLPRLALYAALGCIAWDRLLAGRRNLRDLTEEEIAEIRRKEKEKKNKGKAKE